MIRIVSELVDIVNDPQWMRKAGDLDQKVRNLETYVKFSHVFICWFILHEQGIGTTSAISSETLQTQLLHPSRQFPTRRGTAEQLRESASDGVRCFPGGRHSKDGRYNTYVA